MRRRRASTGRVSTGRVAGAEGAAGRRTVLVAHPSAELYGSDRVLLESVSGLVEAGWHVVATVPGDGPLVQELERRGARVERCASLVLRKSLLRPRALPSLVGQVVAGLGAGGRLLRRVRPAAVYVNTVTIPLWLLLSTVSRVPVLCHVHEAESSAHPWVRRALALPVLLADVVLANSRFSTEVLAGSFRGLGRRAVLVPNGVPGPDAPAPARAELDAPVRVVYVGRLSPRKGVDVAVDALAHLLDLGTDAELDVVGAVFPGYEWYQADLEAQVAALGLGRRVRWHGFTDPVWDLVAAGDVVVVPSRVDEPFGNTAVEALLCGRPVVASATSGLLEATAGYGSARTVAAGDAAALGAALQQVVQDWPRLRSSVAEDARTAAERHSPQRYRARVAQEVESMVDR